MLTYRRNLSYVSCVSLKLTDYATWPALSITTNNCVRAHTPKLKQHNYYCCYYTIHITQQHYGIALAVGMYICICTVRLGCDRVHVMLHTYLYMQLSYSKQYYTIQTTLHCVVVYTYLYLYSLCLIEFIWWCYIQYNHHYTHNFVWLMTHLVMTPKESNFYLN